MKKFRSAVACGKFQPFHNDHNEYILTALEQVEHLVIGITNPDPTYVRDEPLDMRRSAEASNFCTFYERLRMIKESLNDQGVAPSTIDVVPFPINVPSAWKYYVPEGVPVLITMYEDEPWLHRRKALIEDHGWTTEVLWSRAVKTVEGSNIRRLMLEDEPWEHLVPAGTARVIRSSGLVERLQSIARSSGTA